MIGNDNNTNKAIYRRPVMSFSSSRSIITSRKSMGGRADGHPGRVTGVLGQGSMCPVCPVLPVQPVQSMAQCAHSTRPLPLPTAHCPPRTSEKGKAEMPTSSENWMTSHRFPNQSLNQYRTVRLPISTPTPSSGTVTHVTPSRMGNNAAWPPVKIRNPSVPLQVPFHFPRPTICWLMHMQLTGRS